MKKNITTLFVLSVMMLIGLSSASAQTAVWDNSEVTVWANGAEASVLKETGGVKIEQIGTQGYVDTNNSSNNYIQLGNNNNGLVLDKTGNDAIIISATSDITSFKLSYSGNGNGNPGQPYIGYHSEPTAMGSAAATVSSCELGEIVIGGISAAQQITFTPPAGTKFIIIARGASCDGASSTASFRIARMEVYADGGGDNGGGDGETPIAAERFWNFSDYENADFTDTRVFDGLRAVAIEGANLVIEANNKSLDGYSFTKRFKTGGGGFDTAAGDDEFMPTRRYLAFNVPGNAIITVYAMSSSSSAGNERAMIVSNGSEIIKEEIGIGGSAIEKRVVEYTGPATDIYLYSRSGGLNFYGVGVFSSVSTSTSDISIAPKEVKSVSYYDTLGRVVDQTTKGLVIIKTTYEDGTSSSVKINNIGK